MPLDKHHKINYAIGLVALAGSLHAASVAHKPVDVTIAPPAQEQKVGRHEWAPLGGDMTVKLGDALQGMKPGKVTIYCANLHCKRLATDLDDAFQVGQWDSQFEDRAVDSEEDDGLFVGPPGAEAEHLADVIEETTGLKAEVVPIDGIDGLGVIIGKKGK
jgi:hypothetical protein